MKFSVKPESGPSIGSVRQFALHQIGSRLAAEPDLVASCWAQIGALEDHPNLTVIYYSLRRLLRTYVLLEFVAGETLEELVKRSDPAACEREIPLFCRILDAFEGSAKKATDEPLPAFDLELIDFGVGRATASLTSKFHGAVLVGPDGTATSEVTGDYGGSRSQVFAALMELCAKLPGDLPRTAAYGPMDLSGVAVGSFGAKAPPSEAAPPVSQSSAKPVSAARKQANTYLIGAATMLVTLLALYGIGGILSKRTQSADQGKLVRPTIISEPVKAPVEEPPPAPAEKPAAARTARLPKRPVPSIVLASGARPIRQTNLSYPVDAQNEHVSGLVEMQFTIAEDGSVKSPRVVSGDPLLRAGLTEEVSKWVFQPMRVDGKPVPMTTELTIQFNLNP
jgi:TonB family protein